MDSSDQNRNGDGAGDEQMDVSEDKPVQKNGKQPVTGVAKVPVEILEYVFSLISPYKDIDDCAATCRLWRDTVQRIKEKKEWAFPTSLVEQPLQWHMLTNSLQLKLDEPGALVNISPRYGQASCMKGDNLLIYGGLSSASTGFNDLWALNLTERRWKRIVTAGNHPLPKGGASLVVCGEKLILFGGSLYGMSRDDRISSGNDPSMINCAPELHELDLKTRVWRQLPAIGSPAAPGAGSSNYVSCPGGSVWPGDCTPPLMSFHSATIHGSEMVVFGGQWLPNRGPRVLYDQVWCFNLRTCRWYKPVFVEERPEIRRPRLFLSRNTLRPEGRCLHSQIKLDDTHLLIIGGIGGPNSTFRDAWLLEMGSEETNGMWKWFRITIKNPSPPGVFARPFVKVGNYAVVLGNCEPCRRRRATMKLNHVVPPPNSDQPVNPQNSSSSPQPPANEPAAAPAPAPAAAQIQAQAPAPAPLYPEKNVNGRFGSLRSSPYMPHSPFYPAALIEAADGGSVSAVRAHQARNNQLRHESLDRYEKKIKGRRPSGNSNPNEEETVRKPQPPRGECRLLTQGNASCSSTLHMLDISRVLTDKTAEWVVGAGHKRCAPGPPESPTYTFHCGRMSEFIVFGGLVNNGDGADPTNNVFFGSLPPGKAP